MIESDYDLCQSSVFTKTFPAKPGLSFFFPLSHDLSLGSRNHDSDQNPEQTQPKQLPQGEFWD